MYVEQSSCLRNVGLIRIVNRARQFHRGDKNVAALDCYGGWPPILSCRGTESSRVRMVTGTLKARLSIDALRGGAHST